MPNCLAYSATNRCQLPSLIASAPAMRPIGSPARSRSSTSKQMCHPAVHPCDEAAINVMPEREPCAAAERLELPSDVVVLKLPGRIGARHGCFRNIPRSRPREFYRGTDCPQVSSGFKGRPFAQVRGIGKRLPDLFRWVAEFSDENERPLFWALSYLRRASGAGRVLNIDAHHLFLFLSRRLPEPMPLGDVSEWTDYQRFSCVTWMRLPHVSCSIEILDAVTSVGGMVNSAPQAFIRS